jgi:hypothetical protein
MTVEAVGLYLDYSKNRITDETLRRLIDLAEEPGRRLLLGSWSIATLDRGSLAELVVGLVLCNKVKRRLGLAPGRPQWAVSALATPNAINAITKITKASQKRRKRLTYSLLFTELTPELSVTRCTLN